MVVHKAEGGMTGLTRKEAREVEGYLGMWVTIIYTPYTPPFKETEEQRVFSGRFVGWEAGSGQHRLYFEGYSCVVDSRPQFSMWAMNEDEGMSRE